MAMDMLRYLRDTFAAVPGVASCKIGREADITPDDYPLVRLIPRHLAVPTHSQMLPFLSVRAVECAVMFGVAVHPFEGTHTEAGLEGAYEEMFRLERALIDALPKTGPYSAQYIETLVDEESEGSPFRMMALVISVQGKA